MDLVQAKGAGEGLQALKDRIPDLILTAPLLSPFDDGVLDEYLRDLGAAGAHVQTVRIPVLSAGPKKKALAKRLFSLGSKKSTSPAAPDGCDPKVFADEDMLIAARRQLSQCGGRPMLMGRSGAAYEALMILTEIAERYSAQAAAS